MGTGKASRAGCEVLIDLKQRGMEKVAPHLAVGRWSAWDSGSRPSQGLPGDARRNVAGFTRQRNVLNKMPRSVQAAEGARRTLHEIWLAPTTREAESALQGFPTPSWKNTGPEVPEAACECLRKDRDVLLAFYDFPAEHWKHLRTTNPIESVFATVRLRTVKTRGCLSARRRSRWCTG